MDTAAILDACPAMMWRCSPFGYRDWFNRAWLEFTGRTLAEESGFGWLRGVDPGDARAYHETARRARRAGVPYELEYRLRDGGGTYRPVLERASPGVGAGGRVVAYIGVCVERSGPDTELLSGAGRGLPRYLYYLPVGLCFFAPGGRLTYANRFAAGIIDPTISRVGAAALFGVTRALAGERIVRTEALPVAVAGGEIVVDAWADPILDGRGRVTGAVLVLWDVTERSRLEAFRAEFIADAAHELRGPVATLALLAEALGSGIDRMDASQVDEALAALRREGARAGRLVRDLLELSQVERGSARVEIRPVSIGAIVARVLESDPPPDPVSVSVDVDDAAPVAADPDRLAQVLTNLVVNAYRYGGSSIRIGAASGGDGSVVVAVEDDGPGVAADLVPRLFDPFSRGADTDPVSGSGLGLAISRRFVEAFGGELVYEPRRARGSRFVVRLKAATDEP